MKKILTLLLVLVVLGFGLVSVSNASGKRSQEGVHNSEVIYLITYALGNSKLAFGESYYVKDTNAVPPLCYLVIKEEGYTSMVVPCENLKYYFPSVEKAKVESTFGMDRLN